MKKIYTAIITSILSLQTLAISAGNIADYAQSTTSGNSIVYINAPWRIDIYYAVTRSG